MRICSKCGNSYPDDANFCPMDAARLPAALPTLAEPDLDGVTTAMPAVRPEPTTLKDLPPQPHKDSEPPPAGRPEREPARTILDARAFEPAAADPAKAVAGRYEIGRELRATVTGTLHASSDLTTGEALWMKLVDPRVLPTPVLADRAIRELKQLGKVKSDRIARVVDQGRHEDGRTYVVTEPLAGSTLEETVEGGGPMSFERARAVTLAVGEALTEAQKVGVIHRDVSPRNVFVDGDTVRVTDFGLAEPVTERVFGTPAFLSPEQAEGKPVDQRSNIYSLGAVFYYALTGAPPFSGSREELIQQQLHAPPQPPSAKRAGLAPEVDRLVLKALEKSGARRHLTLRQLLNEMAALSNVATPTVDKDDLDAARTIMNLGGRPSGAPPAPSAPPPAEAPAPHATPAPVVPTTTMMGAPMPVPSVPPTPSAIPVSISDQVTAKAAPDLPARSPSIVAETETPLPPPSPAALHGAARFETPAPSRPPAAESPALTIPMPLLQTPVAAAPLPGQIAPVPSAAGHPASSPGPSPAAGPAPPRKAFRETAWFKKGELQEELQKQAGEASAMDPLAGPAPDKEVNVDEATLTTQDRQRLSLKGSGRTEMMQAAKSPQSVIAGDRMSDEEMLAEVDRGKKARLVVGVVVGGAALVGLVLYLVLAR